MSKIREMFDTIVDDGVLTREEHDAFVEEMHADGEIDDEESELISRLFRMIQASELVVVDDEREKAEHLKREQLKKKMSQLSGNSEENPGS